MEMHVLFFIFYLFLFSINDSLCKRSGHSTKSDGKIVGGYSTTIQKIPYQAYLILQEGNKYYTCGGSIISNRYILTAAHCLTRKSKVYVRVGSTDADDGGTMVSSTNFTQHPKYNSRTSDYDVGVVYLAKPLNIDGTNTRIVKLANKGAAVPAGTKLIVSGWGTTSENGQSSQYLMAVEVPTVSYEECKKSYSTLTNRMICAGVPEGGKDSCQGDSGGPAVSTESNVQLGIVSFGAGCARKGYPGVYTNVGSVRDWITSTTGV